MHKINKKRIFMKTKEEILQEKATIELRILIRKSNGLLG